MDAKTARAISELGRVAARLAGVPDNVTITMTICPDRDYSWCGLEDDYVVESEEEIEPPAEDFFYARQGA